MALTRFRCLRAYFCVHKRIRARSYVVIPQIGIAMGFLLQIRMSWLRFRKGVGAGVVVLGAGAVSWLSARLRRVSCQQVVGFCLAIWVYAGVIFIATHLITSSSRASRRRKFPIRTN